MSTTPPTLRQIRGEIARIEQAQRVTLLELWHLRFDRALLLGLDYAHARRVADAHQ